MADGLIIAPAPVPPSVPGVQQPIIMGGDATGLPPQATGTGTSTGTTTLTMSGVTGTIQLGSAITGSGVPAGTTIVQQQSGPFGGNGVYLTSAPTTLDAITLAFATSSTVPFFPEFTPIYPPPLAGEGGGAAPTFPPPTPPPIGHVPIGPLVGPPVAPAGVPPSVAGIPQPVIGGDNPSTFPDFTSTFPSPPVVFENLFMDGSSPPPQTPTTENITIDGWGPPGPQATVAVDEPPSAEPPRRRRRKPV